MGDVSRGGQKNQQQPKSLTACTWSCRSFFSCSRDTIFSSSSLRRASDFSSASLRRANSSFMVAISFSVSALFSSGLILKNSFIHGQFLTLMKARMFHWIISRESLWRPSEKSGERVPSLRPVLRPRLLGSGTFLHPSHTATAKLTLRLYVCYAALCRLEMW